MVLNPGLMLGGLGGRGERIKKKKKAGGEREYKEMCMQDGG